MTVSPPSGDNPIAADQDGASVRQPHAVLGGIAHYFGTHPRLRCEVDAVDVHDNRYGTQLPFDDASFDVVLSTRQ